MSGNVQSMCDPLSLEEEHAMSLAASVWEREVTGDIEGDSECATPTTMTREGEGGEAVMPTATTAREGEGAVTPTTTAQKRREAVTPITTAQKRSEAVTPTTTAQKRREAVTPTTTAQKRREAVTPIMTREGEGGYSDSDEDEEMSSTQQIDPRPLAGEFPIPKVSSS